MRGLKKSTETLGEGNDGRIDPFGTTKDALLVVADNNPGALRVLLEFVELNPILLLMLDEQGIYGEDIWLAYKDVCGEDLNALAKLIMDGDVAAKVAALR